MYAGMPQPREHPRIPSEDTQSRHAGTDSDYLGRLRACMFNVMRSLFERQHSNKGLNNRIAFATRIVLHALGQSSWMSAL